MATRQIGEREKDFVRRMLESAEKKDQAKPNVIDEDPKEIERITESLKKKAQQG